MLNVFKAIEQIIKHLGSQGYEDPKKKGTMTEEAVKMQQLDGVIDALEETVKCVKGYKTSINTQLTEDMISEEIANFTVGGYQFYLKSDTEASYLKENTEEVLKILRDHGFGDLIKEAVAPATFKAFIKEQMDQAENNQVPEYFGDLVKTFTNKKIIIKKVAGKKAK